MLMPTITSAYYIQQKLLAANNHQVPICTGHRIHQVQKIFSEKYNVPQKELDQAFDLLFQDNEDCSIGCVTAQSLYLPGHTPDHSGYRMEAISLIKGDMARST